MHLPSLLIWTSTALLMSGAPAAVAQAQPQTQAKDAAAASQQKAKPKPRVKAEAKKKAKSKQAVNHPGDQRYRDGLTHESKGDDQAALTAFLDAGNAGHGQAQKKLGDIYGKGSKAAKRDYDISLRWYEKARAQGIEIPKPHAFTQGR